MVSRMVSVAVVTGGNKGIGLSIVKKLWFLIRLYLMFDKGDTVSVKLSVILRVTKKKLLRSGKFTHVYLTSRNVERGTEAISRKDYLYG